MLGNLTLLFRNKKTAFMNLDILSATVALFSSLLLGLYLYKTTKPSKIYPVNTKCSIKGLKNLGNTCYINALLQALASSKYFTEWIMSIPINDSLVKVPFIKSLRKILVEMQECNNDNLSASEIISALSFHRWNLSIGLEQDLFELLNVFYTTFEEEINTISNSSDAFEKILASSLFSKTVREPINTLFSSPLARNIWCKNTSYKQLPFFGSICTTLRCCDKSCLNQEVKIDPIGVISLSIPHSTFLSTLSLEFLLRNYFKSEIINDASCDKCVKEKNKKASGIYRKDAFGKLPNILILRIEQLFLSPDTGGMMKATQKITFPKILDVRNFCYFYDKTNDYNNSVSNLLPASNNYVYNNIHNNKSNILNNIPLKANSNDSSYSMNHELSSNILHNNLPGIENFKDECIISRIGEKYSGINEYKYKLRAVCQHIGDHSSGHFITLRKELFFDNEKKIKRSEMEDYNEIRNSHQLTSDCKTQVTKNYLNEWYRVSDNYVSQVDERFLDGCQPYLLVYDKISSTESSYS